MIDREEILGRTWTLRWHQKDAFIAKGLQLLPDGSVSTPPSSNEVYWDVVDRCLCLLSANRYCTARFNILDRCDDGTLRFTGRYTLAQNKLALLELAEDAIPFSDVLIKFESLGDNCEFGIVQRYYLAEPISLFRFNFTQMASLLLGLEEEFSHLDDPDAVSLEIANGSYVGVVQRYGWRYQTPTSVESQAAGDVRLREQKRLRFLRQRFMDDLRTGEKVFVRKGECSSTLAEIQPLYRTLRRLGGCRLLMVTLANSEHPSGSVEEVEDGLLFGYIRRFATYSAATFVDGAAWAKIIRKTYCSVFSSR